MERLINPNSGAIRFNDMNQMVAIIDKLRQYEDTGLTPEEIISVIKKGVPSWIPKYLEYRQAEEQGLLIKLPCKVGDTVYVLMQRNATTEVAKGTVRNVRRYNDDIWWLEFSDLWVDKTFDDFGKSVFLTKEEAEEALKGLEGARD